MIIISSCGNGTSAPSGENVPALPNTNNTGNAVAKTANATVDGKSQSILTDASGKTLYY